MISEVILVLSPLVTLASLWITITVYARYKRDYNALHKDYMEVLASRDEYRKLWEQGSRDLSRMFIELQAVKEIYQGCREAERVTGCKIDFDGTVEIKWANKEEK